MNLKELSEVLGLSPTTVSRALNGYPEVNARTRARVVDAAREHGYVPNSMAKRLATGRAMAIGHVVPLAEHDMTDTAQDILAHRTDVYVYVSSVSAYRWPWPLAVDETYPTVEVAASGLRQRDAAHGGHVGTGRGGPGTHVAPRPGQPAGGTRTESITWMTPLLAGMSTAVTVASFTVTVSPSTPIVTSAPFTVATD